MGPIGASSLIFHSFLDGAAIGLAFQVNITAGIIVALAVIIHDMTDGINTVVVMLKNKQPVIRTYAFLFAASLAPSLGILVTSFINISNSWLAYLLAFFVGEFIYLGASTLVPEMREHPSKKIVVIMALGILLVVLLGMLIPEI
jgi:ZIP family zinc transporter